MKESDWSALTVCVCMNIKQSSHSESVIWLNFFRMSKAAGTLLSHNRNFIKPNSFSLWPSSRPSIQFLHTSAAFLFPLRPHDDLSLFLNFFIFEIDTGRRRYYYYTHTDKKVESTLISAGLVPSPLPPTQRNNKGWWDIAAERDGAMRLDADRKWAGRTQRSWKV